MKKNNKKKLIIIALISLVILIIIFYVYRYFIGSYISNKSSEWANFGSFIGGILGPILTIITLWLIYYFNVQNIELLEKQITDNNIVKLLTNLEEIEIFYFNYVDSAKKHINLENELRQIYQSKERNDNQIILIKEEMNKISEEYLEEKNQGVNKKIIELIYETKIIADLYCKIKSRKYVITYLELAKKVDCRLKSGLITNSEKIFYEKIYYSILKEKIYSLLMLDITGKKYKYSNLKETAYDKTEEIRKELESWSTL